MQRHANGGANDRKVIRFAEFLCGSPGCDITRRHRFANVRFAEKLFALDNVGVAVNRPRNLEPAELRRDPIMLRPGRERADRWMLVVGKDGLRPR